MRPKLSDRQRAILAYMTEYHAVNDLYPTVRDIGDHCEISSSSVVLYNLRRLADYGYLRYVAERHAYVVVRRAA